MTPDKKPLTQQRFDEIRKEMEEKCIKGMSNKELLKISKTVKYSFEDVKWVHDNLPSDYQNERSIRNAIDLAQISGYGLSFLEEIIKIAGSLEMFGLYPSS